MKPSYVLNFFGLKAQNVLNMFLISLFSNCTMISQKSDNCSEKESRVKFKSTDLMNINDIDRVQTILMDKDNQEAHYCQYLLRFPSLLFVSYSFYLMFFERNL